ncbi:MAG: hypothetical protein LUD81_07345, partial [Clostridiales bacterium]|nr:hypothetical protein [Clostridiales bacterium]
MFLKKTYNTIWGTLTVKNKMTGRVVSVKSEDSDEDDVLLIIQELLGVLNYHKDMDFDNCVSDMT